ncbi:MAG: gfo/Idh/MocA family oxidoreductase, partial [Planctomycetes bacterium]|nr:gfo/Idh/MocA family oxidoreductase [Planctomycetota bacterium]
CTVMGDRGTLIYGQEQTEIQLKYLDPEFQWDEITADSGPGKGMCSDHDLPWIEETRKVMPETRMWDQVEIAIAAHLYDALRNDIPFPIKSAEALEVVRVSEIVKKQNPQFQWLG